MEPKETGTGSRTAAGPGSMDRLARFLGLFGLGLGLVEVLAPRRLASAIGVPERRGILRALGVREIASGIGILARGRRPAGFVVSRVLGDVIDLALLGAAARSLGANAPRLRAAAAAVAGVTLLDGIASVGLSRNGGHGRGGAATGLRRRARPGLEVRKAITIGRTPADLYSCWRNLAQLSRIMPHLESVTVIDAKRSHWVAKGPAGFRVEWDAEIVADVPDERIAWRSVEGSEVDTEGSVRFERTPEDRGTVVRVDLRYDPPAGAAGAAVAKLFGRDAAFEVHEGLRAFKQVMETGEVATAEGPRGTCR
jgi:uncharacterized membrane protein